MKNEPLLSVIIPIYNVQSYLAECMDSVLGQKYKNLEIICVDDGSTDHSGEIVEKYANLDKRVRVIHKNNGGLVSARKAGISLATGQYATYVDSDDWIDPNMYFDLIGQISEHDADVVTSGCFREYDNYMAIDSESISPGVYEGELLRNNLLSNMVGHEMFYQQNIKTTVWSKIYRTELIMQYQMKVDNQISIGEDAAVVYPLLLNTKKVVVSGRNYYHYRIRPGSIAMNTGVKEIKSLDILEHYLKEEFNKKTDVQYLEYQFNAITMFNRLIAAPETVICYKKGFLYPYSEVKKEDRILIYGSSRYGKKLYGILERLGANIAGVVDQNKKRGIISIEELATVQFDKIVIGVLNANLVSQIITNINQMDIKEGSLSRIDLNILLS